MQDPAGMLDELEAFGASRPRRVVPGTRSDLEVPRIAGLGPVYVYTMYMYVCNVK